MRLRALVMALALSGAWTAALEAAPAAGVKHAKPPRAAKHAKPPKAPKYKSSAPKPIAHKGPKAVKHAAPPKAPKHKAPRH